MPPELAPLLNVGAAGVVLAWFMTRLEKRLSTYESAVDQQRQALDRNTRATLLLLIGINNLSPGTKQQAHTLLREAGHD